MKKKLEADLISIAHRILQLKNKSDINQLYLETQKLYEKLSVLRFIEEHFSEVQPTIGRAALEQKIESIFEQKALSQYEIKPTIVSTVTEEIQETLVEETTQAAKTNEAETVLEAAVATETPLEVSALTEPKITEVEELIVVEEEKKIEEEASMTTETASIHPDFELAQGDIKETEQEMPKKKEPVQISFEDLLGGNYHDTQFVKVQEIKDTPKEAVINPPKEIIVEEGKEEMTKEETVEQKAISLNEKLAKGINIDLNDRIAFIKHLFGNNSEDYNRVLNQLITFNTFYETRNFVQEMVKPDYNNWEGKQDYEERFMDIIEKKFL